MAALSETGSKIMEMRALLLSLEGLVDAYTVFQIMGMPTRDELELLASTNSWINKQQRAACPDPRTFKVE